MINYEKENNGFVNLLNCIDKLYEQKTIANAIFTMVFSDKTIKAKYDTMYETDNGLELDDPNYEEYNAIAFENLETHELFEVNYLDLPKEVYYNGEKIL